MRETQASDFSAILPQSSPLDRGGVHRLAHRGCLDIHRVEWVRAWLAADGSRLLCWFRARDAESVRLVLRPNEPSNIMRTKKRRAEARRKV